MLVFAFLATNATATLAQYESTTVESVLIESSSEVILVDYSAELRTLRGRNAWTNVEETVDYEGFVTRKFFDYEGNPVAVEIIAPVNRNTPSARFITRYSNLYNVSIIGNPPHGMNWYNTISASFIVDLDIDMSNGTFTRIWISFNGGSRMFFDGGRNGNFAYAFFQPESFVPGAGSTRETINWRVTFPDHLTRTRTISRL
ncbi:MAG: hypothetical protein FWG68_01085 [Defluviitaleaceae bacterium]|nr:hypothetical protein [Defluviitaleaceae bacterium]